MTKNYLVKFKSITKSFFSRRSDPNPSFTRSRPFYELNCTRKERYRRNSYISVCSKINLPQLFKRWIALSTGQITIHWKLQLISLTLIHWIVIYPADSAIQTMDNCCQMPIHSPFFFVLFFYFLLILALRSQCFKNPCLNEGKCIDVGDTYKCICKEGYDGSTCEGM